MGDFSARFGRGDSGINTVEGNVAGSRAASLSKQREKDQHDFEEKKRRIQQEQERGSRPMEDKFVVVSESLGKVTSILERETETAAAAAAAASSSSSSASLPPAAKKDQKKEKRKKMSSMLSFGVDDEEEGGEDAATSSSSSSSSSAAVAPPLKKSLKDPTAETSFLPDKGREHASQEASSALKAAWHAEQSSVKSSKLLIVYSYWDGSGHRREMVVKKGSTILDFLSRVCKDLSADFKELATGGGEDLLYVKEDLIIPSDVTFYDLIALKARGKSGPLFNFDVREDIRVGAIDSRVEKDESHPGKVVERRWFERNKHIFPASRWEVWQAGKDYGSFTIHGGELAANKKR